MSAFYREKVLSVQHWTDTLFSFRATRDSGFRFQNGQFAMIGLEIDGRPLLRAYSMASANHEEELEFFSIKVQDGPLTSRLQKIKEGDTIKLGDTSLKVYIMPGHTPGSVTYTFTAYDNKKPYKALVFGGPGPRNGVDGGTEFLASCWFMAAGRSPNSPMARNWSRSCATTNCSGRY